MGDERLTRFARLPASGRQLASGEALKSRVDFILFEWAEASDPFKI
jgi:hypothetical protein